MIKTAMYSAAYVLLLFWANIFPSVLCAEETPQEIIANLLDQESCGGCLEVTEFSIEGGTNKTILLFKRIENGTQEIRLQVVSPGVDYGYAYYSKIDAQAKEHLKDIMWAYRPQDGKVRRYNSILTTFLDTGIPPYLVDHAGWWKFYRWTFGNAEKFFFGTPTDDYSFLPNVIVGWDTYKGIRYLASLALVKKTPFLTAMFSNPEKIGEKVRTKKIVVGPPNGPFTTISLSSIRFEKADEKWLSQIFHPDRLSERRTPTNLKTYHGEILAKIDFLS